MRTGGFWIVFHYHIPGKLATASYSLLFFFFLFFLLLDIIGEEWGLTYTHAGLVAPFLSLWLGGLVGCGVREGWFCILKALLSKVCQKQKKDMRNDVEIDQNFLWKD